MADITEELIVEILLLLPVVHLLRFRCVSKKWRSLIDCPGFAKSHLDQSKKTFFFMILYPKPSVHYGDFDSSVSDASARPIVEKLMHPCPGNDRKFIGILGPCNGLVCLCTSDGGAFLWNPITRKHFQVPQFQQPGVDQLWSWDFVYDSNFDDYKVVSVACLKSLNDGSDRFVVRVYSLKSGLWKSIGELPYSLVGFMQHGVFVNGALHWRVFPHWKQHGSPWIAALDLGNEEFHLVSRPECFDTDIRKWLRRLMVLDGCLCALTYDRDSHGFDSHCFDLWVMKEYGAKESWTRLITCTSYPSRLTPLVYTKSGKEFLFVDSSGILVQYDFETRSFKKMILKLPPNLGFPRVYVPSLIRPENGVCAGNSYLTL